jgi:hypothetical protein
MNFVYVRGIDTQEHSRRIIKIDAVYMHSHPLGEKLDNIKRNSKDSRLTERMLFAILVFSFWCH